MDDIPYDHKVVGGGVSSRLSRLDDHKVVGGGVPSRLSRLSGERMKRRVVVPSLSEAKSRAKAPLYAQQDENIMAENKSPYDTTKYS